jgi:hypothetical protein
MAAVVVSTAGILAAGIAPAQALAWPTGGQFVVSGTNGGGAVWQITNYGIEYAWDVNDESDAKLAYPNEIYNGFDYLFCGDGDGDASDSTVTEEANGDITIDCQPSVDELWDGLTVTQHYRLYAASDSGYLARQWAEIHNTTGATIDMTGNEIYNSYYYNYDSWNLAYSYWTASDGTTGTNNEADGQVWGVNGDSRGNVIVMGSAWGAPCKASEFTAGEGAYFNFPSSVNVIPAGETVNLVTFVNMVFPAENTEAAATAAYDTALAQAKAEFDLGLEGRLAAGLAPGLNVAGWCGPAAALPDTGANASVIGSSVAISAGLLVAGVLALVMVRRRQTTK